MDAKKTLKYVIKNQIELNLSYMPFIKGGGLFIPTGEQFDLGDQVLVELQIPGHNDVKIIEEKVVWVTPVNSLYQIYPGIGIQFGGENPSSIHDLIKSNLDNTMDAGGYAYGSANTTKE